MNQDAFSKRHPIVNFIFFLGAIGFGVVIQHPLYLAAAIWMILDSSPRLKEAQEEAPAPEAPQEPAETPSEDGIVIIDGVEYRRA